MKQEGQIPPSESFFTFLKKCSQFGTYWEQLLEYAPSVVTDSIKDAEKQDIAEMVKSYANSINAGHRVVLVSHSQGNLFGVRAYEKLESWQRKYFKQVSVASPASKVVGGGGHVTSVDDMIIVPLIEVAGALPANAKNIKPTESTHEFVRGYLNGDVTSGIIKNLIQTAYNNAKSTGSQWILKDNKTCSIDGCENKIREVTHRYDSTLNSVMNGIKVYPFEDDGKLYPIYYGYIKAESEEGTIFSDDKDFKNSDICYTLYNKDTRVIGYIKKSEPCPKCDGINSTSGFVEVSLKWENPKALLDLNVDFPNGHYDINAPECRFKHFYSTSEKGVTEGSYPVTVNYEELYSMSLIEKLSDDILIKIKVPGKDEMMLTNYKQIEYIKGHVADIIVYRDNNNTTSYNSTSNCGGCSIGSGGGGSGGGGWGSGGGGGGGGGGSASGDRRTSGPYIPADTNITIKYLYDILWYISKGALGPLSGADVNVYKIEDYNLGTNSGINPIAVFKTSEGSSVLAAGNIPSLNGLEQDKLYVVEIKGGLDIDADDDGEADLTPVKNNGYIRLVMTGYELNKTAFKVNILTEIIYRLAKNAYTGGKASYIQKSDEAAQCLLDFDMNFDGYVDTLDAVSWMPFYGKDELLNHNYSMFYEPIIDKIHKDEDISIDINKMVKYPIFKDNKLYFLSNATVGSNLGKAPYVCGYGFDKYAVKGVNGAYFDINSNGDIILKAVPSELKEYITDIEMSNDNNEKANGSINIVMIHENAPFLVKNPFADAIPDIIEDGFNLGQAVIVHEGKAPIENIWLEGYGADNFEIDKNGYITISSRSNINRDDVAYRLKVFASNRYGESIPVEIIIGVYTESELIPVLRDTHINLYDDNMGGLIGKVNKLENIFCPVTSYKLNDNSVFDIDSNGGIYAKTTPAANSYTLNVYARSRCGNSNAAELSIAKQNRVVSSIQTKMARRVIVLSDNTKAFIADGNGGVKIADISDVNSISIINSINSSYAYDIALNSNETRLFIADGNGGVKIYDITQAVPDLIMSVNTISARSIALSKDETKLFISSGDKGVNMIDISDISNPNVKNLINGYSVYDTVLSPDQTILFTAGGFGGVKLFDIGDISNPKLISSAETVYAAKIVLSNGKLFTADATGGVKIINAALPNEIIASISTTNANSLTLSQDNKKLYVSDMDGGIKVFDINGVPVLTETINIYENYDLAVLNNKTTAVTANGENGVKVIRLDK
jgi:hypothetical protein